jgi:hypothetical protein
MLDSQFMIFFRTPPRMTIVEMTGHLPCAGVLFATQNGEECKQLAVDIGGAQLLSLSFFIKNIMQDS